MSIAVKRCKYRKSYFFGHSERPMEGGKLRFLWLARRTIWAGSFLNPGVSAPPANVLFRMCIARTMSQEPTSDRAVRRQSRRSQRIRTACLRCQQRKIRVKSLLHAPDCPCADQDQVRRNISNLHFLQQIEQRVRVSRWQRC
jgi:hypothetical protein